MKKPPNSSLQNTPHTEQLSLSTVLFRKLVSSSTVLFRKKNIHNKSMPPQESKSNKRCLIQTQPEGAGGMTIVDGWQVHCVSTLSMDCLLSKLSENRSPLPTDSHTSLLPPPTSGGSDELEQNTADLTT